MDKSKMKHHSEGNSHRNSSSSETEEEELPNTISQPFGLYRKLDQIAAEVKAGKYKQSKKELEREKKFRKRQEKLWEKTKLYRDVEFEDSPVEEETPKKCKRRPLHASRARPSFSSPSGFGYGFGSGTFMPNISSRGVGVPPCDFGLPFLYETEVQEERRKAKELIGIPEEEQDNLEASQFPYESSYVKDWVMSNFGKFPKFKLPKYSREKVKLENLPQTGTWFRPFQLYKPIVATENHHGKPRTVKRVIGFRELLKKRGKLQELKLAEKLFRPYRMKQRVKDQQETSCVINISGNSESESVSAFEDENLCVEKEKIATDSIPISWDDDNSSLPSSWTDVSSSICSTCGEQLCETCETTSHDEDFNIDSSWEVVKKAEENPKDPVKLDEELIEIKVSEVEQVKSSEEDESTSSKGSTSSGEIENEMKIFERNVTPCKWPFVNLWNFGTAIPVGGMARSKSKKRKKEKKSSGYPPSPWSQVFNAPEVKKEKRRRTKMRAGPPLPEGSSTSDEEDERPCKEKKLRKPTKSRSSYIGDKNKKKRRKKTWVKSSSSTDQETKKHGRKKKMAKQASESVSGEDFRKKSTRNRTIKSSTTFSSIPSRKSEKKPTYYKKKVITTKTYYYVAPREGDGNHSSSQDQEIKKPKSSKMKKEIESDALGRATATSTRKTLKIRKRSKRQRLKSQSQTASADVPRVSSHSIRILVKKRSSIIRKTQSFNVFEKENRVLTRPMSKRKRKEIQAKKEAETPWYLQKIDQSLEGALIQNEIIKKPPRRIQPITLSASSDQEYASEKEIFRKATSIPILPYPTKSEKYLLKNMDGRPMLPPSTQIQVYASRLEEKEAIGSKGKTIDKMDKNSIELKIYNMEQQPVDSKQQNPDQGRPPRLHESTPIVPRSEKPGQESNKGKSESAIRPYTRKIAKYEKDNEWLELSDTDRELADALEGESLGKEYLAWMNPLVSYESQNMRRSMALYNWLAKITWRQPITNMEAEDHKLIHYFVNRKRQFPFIITSLLLFGAMVGLIQSFVDINVNYVANIHGEIDQIELSRYKIFAAFVFINLIIVSMWSIAVILHDGFAIAQYLNYMAASLTKLETSATKDINGAIRRNIIIFSIYAGITTLAFISNTPSTVKGASGFIALLFCRPIAYKFRPIKEKDLILLQIGGFAVHLYIMFCIRLMQTLFQIVAVFLRNGARFWNFKFGLCFAQFGTQERGQLYRLKWAQSHHKLFHEHRLLNGLSRRYGFTFGIGLFAFFILQLGLLAIVLVIMFFDDETKHYAENEQIRRVRSHGYDLKLKNTELEDAITNVFVAVYTLGDFLITTHVIASAGKAVMDGYEFVRRQGLIRCDTSHERRLVMSLQWSFSARNPPLISVRNFFRVDRKSVLAGISFMITIVSLIIQLKQTTYVTLILKKPCNVTHEGYWAEDALDITKMRWCHIKVSVRAEEAEHLFKIQDMLNKARITTTPRPEVFIYFINENCTAPIVFPTPDEENATATKTLETEYLTDYVCPWEEEYQNISLTGQQIPVCKAKIETKFLDDLDKVTKRYLREEEWFEVKKKWEEDCSLTNKRIQEDYYTADEFSGNCRHEGGVGEDSATFDWKALIENYYQPCWSPVLKKYILLQQVRICRAETCNWIPLKTARHKEFQHLVEVGVIDMDENAATHKEWKEKYMDCGLNPYPRIDFLYFKYEKGGSESMPIVITPKEYNHNSSFSGYKQGEYFVNCAGDSSSVHTDRDDCNWQGLKTLLIDEGGIEFDTFYAPVKKIHEYDYNEANLLIESTIIHFNKEVNSLYPELYCDAKGCHDMFQCFYDHIGRCKDEKVRAFCAPFIKPVKAYLYGDDCTYLDANQDPQLDTFRTGGSVQKDLKMKTNKTSWKFVHAKKDVICEYCSKQTAIEDITKEIGTGLTNMDWCQSELFNRKSGGLCSGNCPAADVPSKDKGCYCGPEIRCKQCTGVVDKFGTTDVIKAVVHVDGNEAAGHVYLLGEPLYPYGLKNNPRRPYTCSGYVNKHDLLRYQVISEEEMQLAETRWNLRDSSLAEFYMPETLNKYINPDAITNLPLSVDNFEEVCKQLEQYLPVTGLNPRPLFFHHARIFREPCRRSGSLDIESLIQIVGKSVGAKIEFYDMSNGRTKSCWDNPYPFWNPSSKSNAAEIAQYRVCRYRDSAWFADELKEDDFDDCGNLRQPEYEKSHETDIYNHCNYDYAITTVDDKVHVHVRNYDNRDDPYGVTYDKDVNIKPVEIKLTGAKDYQFNAIRNCWNLHFAQARCADPNIKCKMDESFQDEIYYFFKFETVACDEQAFYLNIYNDNVMIKSEATNNNGYAKIQSIARDQNASLRIQNQMSHEERLQEQDNTFCSTQSSPTIMNNWCGTVTAEKYCQYRLTFSEFWGVVGTWNEEAFSPPLQTLCPLKKDPNDNTFHIYLVNKFYPCQSNKLPYVQVFIHTLSKEGRLTNEDIFEKHCPSTATDLLEEFLFKNDEVGGTILQPETPPDELYYFTLRIFDFHKGTGGLGEMILEVKKPDDETKVTFILNDEIKKFDY